MTSSKVIRAEIREWKAAMKRMGVRQISCFNGGLSPAEYRCNSQLFALKVKLETALKAEQAVAA